MESKQIAETKTYLSRFLALVSHLPVEDSFAIAEFIHELVAQEKRKEVIAFLRWKETNYGRSGSDSYFHFSQGHNAISETSFFTSEELYDLYLLSLTQNKEL